MPLSFCAYKMLLLRAEIFLLFWLQQEKWHIKKVLLCAAKSLGQKGKASWWEWWPSQMFRNSVRRKGQFSHFCSQFIQCLDKIKHSKSPGSWCHSSLSRSIKNTTIKPWAVLLKKVAAKPASVLYASCIRPIRQHRQRNIHFPDCNSGADSQLC